MGSSSSSVTQNINNFTVNQSTLDIFNEQVNKSVTNTIIKNAQAIDASSSQDQNLKIGNVTAVGKGSKIDITSEDLQDSNISVQALQQSIQQTDLQQTLSSAITANLQNGIQQSALNKLVSAGLASQKNGMFGSIANPFSNTNSSVNTNINNTAFNQTNTQLKNIVDNVTKQYTDMSSTKQCYLNNVQSANTEIGNITALAGAEIGLSLTSTQMSKSFLKCTQINQQTTSVIDQLKASMGLKVVNDIKSTTETESTATSKSELTNKGLGSVITAIGNAISGIIGAYGKIVIGIVIACLVLCCLSSFGGVAMMMMGSKSSSSDDNSATVTTTGTVTATGDDGAGDEE